MNGWTAAVLSMVFVINPAGVGRATAWGERTDRSWRAEVLTVLALAAATLVGWGLLTAPILNSLDISTPTFRLTAAVLSFVTGAKWLLTPTSPIEELDPGASATILGLTMLLTPGPVFVAMAANGDGGTAAGIVSVAVAIGVVSMMLILPRVPEPTSGWLARFSGGITVALAVVIGLDAVRTV